MLTSAAGVGRSAVAGLASGAASPAANVLLSRWAPPLERSRLSAVAFAGLPFGVIIGVAFSWFLGTVQMGSVGLPAGPLVLGVAAAIVAVAFTVLASSDPRLHSSITRRERFYILQSIEEEQVLPLLYRSVLWPVF